MTSDEQVSIRILKAIAQARLAPLAAEPPRSEEIRVALAAAFGSTGDIPASEGDLARAALDVLKEDPAFVEPISVMTSQAETASAPETYVEPVTIGLTTPALLMLQTRLQFKIDHTGKWSVEIDKKAAGDSAVKLLVER